MYNINPLLWGPHLWKFMHYLTLSYPDNPNIDEQNKFKNFFMMIGQYLPCEKCRVNYKINIQTLPLTDSILSSRNNLIKWLFDLHNIVNKETGKTMTRTAIEVLRKIKNQNLFLSKIDNKFSNTFLNQIGPFRKENLSPLIS